jgi:hypothetical protein
MMGANIAAIELLLAGAAARGSAAGGLLASTVSEFTVPDEAGKPQMTRKNSTTVHRIKMLGLRKVEEENECFMTTP